MGLHVIGDLTRGEFLATNAVENTVRQSVQLAEVVIRRLTHLTLARRPRSGHEQ
jgi:hypothetical protein